MLRLDSVQQMPSGYCRLAFSTGRELGPRRKVMIATALCSHPAVRELHASAKPEETGAKGCILAGMDAASTGAWMREADNQRYTTVRFALDVETEDGRTSSLQVQFPGEGLMHVMTNGAHQHVAELLGSAVDKVLAEMPLEEPEEEDKGAETP